MPHDNGRIFAIQNGVYVGITTDDVSAVLGELSGDIATLCQSSRINKWSKRKPVRSYSPGELSLSDFAAANFGFDLNRILAYSGSEALTKAKNNGGVWPYLRIRNDVDYSRITDFDGYNHNAVQPYECKDPQGTYGQRSVPIQVYDKADEGAELTLLDFTELADGTDTGRTIDEWRIGLAWRKGTTGSIQVKYMNKTLDDCFDDGGSGEEPLEQLDFPAPTDGTYEWCLFITDYDEDDDPNSGDSYRYVYLPGGFGEVAVSASGGDIVPPAGEPLTINLDDIHVSGSPNVKGLVFDFTVEADDEYEVEVSVELYDESDYPIDSGSDSVETLSSEEYVYPEITGINFKGNYETTDIYVRISYRYRRGSGAWTQRYYNPISGQIATAAFAASQLQDIIESLNEDEV